MAKVTFITGNPNKTKYFSELVGQHIAHHSADVHEIQTLDLEELITHKAKAAYAQLKTPVLVEDTSLIIKSLGKLPGPFIRWFLQELGSEGICRLADMNSDRSALAGTAFGYYDGKQIKIFKSFLEGSISVNPTGDSGFGWNAIFIPNGTDKTLGEMDQEAFKSFYTQIKPFSQIKEFLASLDKK
jgi:non-canonical purine NTP pyrophosphatase (RdgB/HAM1 family)